MGFTCLNSQWTLFVDVWNVFFLSLSWSFCWSGHVSSSHWSNIRKVTSLFDCPLMVVYYSDFVIEWILRVIIYTIDYWQLTFTRDVSWPQKLLNGSIDIARWCILILLTIDNWLLAKCGLVPNYENDTTTPWCEAFWLFECTLLTSDNWPWFFLLLMFIFLLGLNICITLLTARSSLWSKMSQRVTGIEEQGSILDY